LKVADLKRVYFIVLHINMLFIVQLNFYHLGFSFRPVTVYTFLSSGTFKEGYKILI